MMCIKCAPNEVLHLKVDDLRIQVALELHRQLAEVVHADLHLSTNLGQQIGFAAAAAAQNDQKHKVLRAGSLQQFRARYEARKTAKCL